jgi:hypothetical protein
MELADTAKILTRVAAAVPAALVRVRSGPFALVEHLWHLADLEREGFGARIARLMAEDDPFLPDFDGERIAREREYLRKDVASGLAAFAAARAENLARLAVLTDSSRAGRQEGVGRVTLAEMPRRMLEHDLAHFNELADLLEELVPRHPLIGELRNRGPHSSRAA